MSSDWKRLGDQTGLHRGKRQWTINDPRMRRRYTVENKEMCAVSILIQYSITWQKSMLCMFCLSYFLCAANIECPWFFHSSQYANPYPSSFAFLNLIYAQSNGIGTPDMITSVSLSLRNSDESTHSTLIVHVRKYLHIDALVARPRLIRQQLKVVLLHLREDLLIFFQDFFSLLWEIKALSSDSVHVRQTTLVQEGVISGITKI